MVTTETTHCTYCQTLFVDHVKRDGGKLNVLSNVIIGIKDKCTEKQSDYGMIETTQSVPHSCYYTFKERDKNAISFHHIHSYQQLALF